MSNSRETNSLPVRANRAQSFVAAVAIAVSIGTFLWKRWCAGRWNPVTRIANRIREWREECQIRAEIRAEMDRQYWQDVFRQYDQERNKREQQSTSSEPEMTVILSDDEVLVQPRPHVPLPHWWSAYHTFADRLMCQMIGTDWQMAPAMEELSEVDLKAYARMQVTGRIMRS